jgi:hypothetical protein
MKNQNPFRLWPAWAGCFLVLGAAAPCPGQMPSLPNAAVTSDEIPSQFRDLYRELAGTLEQATNVAPFEKRGVHPLVAPGLMMAGSGYGPAAADSPRWKDLLATLDAFKAMGMNATSVMIAAPDLTLSDPQPLIAFYRRLTDEIHARGMKLYVEHFDNPPFSPHAHHGFADDATGRKEFLRMRAAEAALIYREIQPDFLSLITEPATMGRWSHLTFSAAELADWVGEIATELKTAGSPTHVGAGAPSWEPEEFVLRLARQPSLDYVDIHLYALNLDGVDQLAQFSILVRKIREVRPAMPITIGETWLYKHGASEPKGMLNRDAYFRDNFSFWSALDVRFLSLVMGLAQKENVGVIAPYFSEHFFTYYTFGDEESGKLPPWPASVAVAWQKALVPIREHRLSVTGKAVSAMLDGAK